MQLVDLLEKAPSSLPHQRRPHNDSEAKRKEQALKYIENGYLSKGVAIVAGHGTADPTDKVIQALVKDKFARRAKALPPGLGPLP